MQCPVCEKEMIDLSYNYYGIADWDMDYPATHYSKHICTTCDIKYENGKWDIPEQFKATDKQIYCADIICKNLNLNPPPPVKKLMITFIQRNYEQSKFIARRRKYGNSYYLQEETY